MIKPIDEIPMTLAEKRRSAREMIQEDLKSAIEQGISKFEFVGDYNFKYLQGYAREESTKLTRKLAYEWVKEHPEYKSYGFRFFDCLDDKHMAEEIFKITSLKAETPEQRRVFCWIDLGMDSVFRKYADERVQRNEEYKKRKEMKNGL